MNNSHETRLLRGTLKYVKNVPAVLNVLEEAHKLLSVKEQWTTRVIARDASGRDTDPTKDNAVCFCSVGAIERAAYVLSPDKDRQNMADACDLLTTQISCSVAYYNDSHTHDEVVALFAKTIAQVKAAMA